MATAAPILVLNTAPGEKSYFNLLGSGVSWYSGPIGVYDEDGFYVFNSVIVAGGYGWATVEVTCLGTTGVAVKALPISSYITITVTDPLVTLEHVSVVYVDEPIMEMRRKLLGNEPSAKPMSKDDLAKRPGLAKVARAVGHSLHGTPCLSTHPNKPANIMLYGPTFSKDTNVDPKEVTDTNGYVWSLKPKPEDSTSEQFRIQLTCIKEGKKEGRKEGPLTGLITITVTDPAWGSGTTVPPVAVSYVADPDS